MSKVDTSALHGLLVSWNTWDALQAWSRKGMEAAQAVLRAGGLDCVHQEKRRQHVKVDMTHQRLVWWMWPAPWQDDSLGIYAGLFMGKPYRPVTEEGLPDLLLSLHVKPDSPRGTCLRNDAALKVAAERWKGRPPDGVMREFCTAADEWELLRSRVSSKEIATAADPGMRLIGWMKERAQEWVDDGIAKRLAELVGGSAVP